MLGARPGAPEAELMPLPHHMSVHPGSALSEYLREEAPGRLVASLLARSRLFDALVAVMPGMAELLTIGNVWELAQRPRHRAGARTYDLVVLDAPATGHAGALLAAPGTFRSLAAAGPMARQSAAIERMLRDPRATGLILVAAPEQMAITEALELRKTVSGKLGISTHAVIVNRTLVSPFNAVEARRLAEAREDPAVRAACWLHERAAAQRAQLVRLRHELERVRCVTLPFVFAGLGELDRVRRLAELLDRGLG